MFDTSVSGLRDEINKRFDALETATATSPPAYYHSGSRLQHPAGGELRPALSTSLRPGTTKRVRVWFGGLLSIMSTLAR